MTLDEAIKHCLDIADGQDKCAEISVSEHAKERISQCAADHRQLAEWLTDYKELTNSIGAVKLSDIKEALELIRDYKADNIEQKKLIAEYKRLLKAAVEDMYNSVNDVHCKYCSKWHTDQCQETSHLDCYIENKFKWRHAAEALALIGEDIDVPAIADGTNFGGKIDSWISCKDNMPDTFERGLSTMYSDCCLVCDAFGWVGMAYYITDGQKSWWEFADAQNKNKIDWTEVTHWQPLPELPKDGEQNG